MGDNLTPKPNRNVGWGIPRGKARKEEIQIKLLFEKKDFKQLLLLTN